MTSQAWWWCSGGRCLKPYAIFTYSRGGGVNGVASRPLGGWRRKGRNYYSFFRQHVRSTFFAFSRSISHISFLISHLVYTYTYRLQHFYYHRSRYILQHKATENYLFLQNPGFDGFAQFMTLPPQ